MALLRDDTVRTTWTNYGTRGTDNQFGGELAGEEGKLRVVEYSFTYDELPGHSGAAVDIDDSNLAVTIPAGARITAATFDILDAFGSDSATTDLIVGTYQADGGGAIDDNGIFEVTELDQTDIAAETRIVASAGAQLNGAVLAEEAAIVVAPSANDLNAGRAVLTVSYYMVPGPQGHQNQDGTYDGSAIP